MTECTNEDVGFALEVSYWRQLAGTMDEAHFVAMLKPHLPTETESKTAVEVLISCTRCDRAGGVGVGLLGLVGWKVGVGCSVFLPGSCWP